jgi:hypothetical protein
VIADYESHTFKGRGYSRWVSAALFAGLMHAAGHYQRAADVERAFVLRLRREREGGGR